MPVAARDDGRLPLLPALAPRETSCKVSPATSSSSFTAISPSEITPTSSPSSTTGNLRICRRAMMRAASCTSASGSMVSNSRLRMSSAVNSLGSFPSAMQRITMSRSVTMPASLSSSKTGMAPVSSSFILLAISLSVVARVTVATSSVINSRTFMALSSCGGVSPEILLIFT